ADLITAEQALGMGLVNAVVPAGELLQRARDVALKIASKGPLAVAAAKRVVLRGEAIDLPAACELEAQAFAMLFGSEDQKAGMRAFLEKSKASFKRR
ncbi:MAG TPA: enoyl-CoA hydratase-related protein, partial [Polyangiaceae bacterium]|nr:enoyl-CoA hydratase-related protein [Polyangiaceae bacterium]